MGHGTKIQEERVLDKRLRERLQIGEMEFRIMLGRSAVDIILIMR